MHLKSILNHVHPLKSFVYKRARLIKAAGLPARIEVEQVPWATGKCQLTTSYRWFLAAWAKRLLWAAEERTEKSLRSFFESLSTEVKAGIQFVASDM